jgi:formylglycine-generating enzyme required for sulfatase activity
LNPTFSPATTSYAVSVANSITSITVTGTAADAGATVSANSGVPQSLAVGANVITITVTAQDGATTRDYSVTVTRSADYLSPTIGTLPYIAGGTFIRDSIYQTTVSAFRISRYEVTRSQFQAIMGTDPSNATYSSGTVDPVQMVNWYQAITFCNKLSLAEGLAPVYSVSGVNFSTLTFNSIPTSTNATWDAAVATWSANGYRLPTDMEWMWAAMGSTIGWGTHSAGIFTDGINKPFAGYQGISSATGTYAVFGYSTAGEAGRTTTPRTNPVGGKAANEIGLFDLSGNVQEWVWDWYGTWSTGSLTDYRGPAAGSGLRLVHGGDWYYGATGCAVLIRDAWNPALQQYTVGFRVVRQ